MARIARTRVMVRCGGVREDLLIRRFRSPHRGVAQVQSHPRIALSVVAAISALTPLTVAATQTHTISPGETLSGIAGTYGVGLGALAEINGIDNVNLIYAGASLIIPGMGEEATPEPTRYTVVAGDTLARIATNHGLSVAQIASDNGIANPDLIVIGQVLTIGQQALPAQAPLPSAEVRAILQEVEAEFGIPPGLLQALAWQESGWQQHVISHAGAVGVTQVLPITALWALEYLLGTDAEWETSARDNARVGASVVRHYLNLTDGDVRWSLAAYYQGWQSVQDFGIFEETELYIANVMTLWAEFA
ncbi:MAG: lytic transglycosylase [Gemmatimonadales bacterium]